MDNKYTVKDLFELNIRLKFPSNVDLISKEFKKIPACNKAYEIVSNISKIKVDNIKSILNKIHTSNYPKLSELIFSIIENDNTEINNLLNLIEEYLNKTAMITNTLECYCKLFLYLLDNNLLTKETIFNYVKNIYYKQCYNKYTISLDVSNLSEDIILLFPKLSIVPVNNKITCDNMVDLASYLNNKMKININLLTYIQQYIYINELDIIKLIIESFINNNTINNYNIISLNAILINNSVLYYIKLNYYDKLYDMYSNLDNYINVKDNDYDYKICINELEKLIKNLNKIKTV